MHEDEEYLREMEEAKNRGELGHVADANFHLAISYATHNTLLIHFMNSIYGMVEKVTYEIGAKMYQNPHSYQDLFDQHVEIFEAIRAKDPDAAYIKMLNHMYYIEREIRNVVIEDYVPPILKLVKRFPTLKPKIKKSGDKIKLTWNIQSLKPGEEVIISYRVKPIVEIVGTLKLPQAKIKYVDKGKVKGIPSSKKIK